jgi:hypothetical protein
VITTEAKDRDDGLGPARASADERWMSGHNAGMSMLVVRGTITCA